MYNHQHTRAHKKPSRQCSLTVNPRLVVAAAEAVCTTNNSHKVTTAAFRLKTHKVS